MIHATTNLLSAIKSRKTELDRDLTNVAFAERGSEQHKLALDLATNLGNDAERVLEYMADLARIAAGPTPAADGERVVNAWTLSGIRPPPRPEKTTPSSVPPGSMLLDAALSERAAELNAIYSQRCLDVSPEDRIRIIYLEQFDEIYALITLRTTLSSLMNLFTSAAH